MPRRKKRYTTNVAGARLRDRTIREQRRAGRKVSSRRTGTGPYGKGGREIGKYTITSYG